MEDSINTTLETLTSHDLRFAHIVTFPVSGVDPIAAVAEVSKPGDSIGHLGIHHSRASGSVFNASLLTPLETD